MERAFLMILTICVLMSTALPAAPVDQPNSELVIQVQQRLEAKGFDPGPVDGILGPKTRAAVRGFQQSEELRVTGRLDSETLGRLGLADRDGVIDDVGAAFATAGKATAKGAKTAAKGVAKAGEKTAEAVSEAADESKDFLVGEDSDEILAERVKEKLRKHPRIDADQIDVAVDEGIVTLTFHGNDRTEFNRAVGMARSVNGVQKVFVRFES